VLIVGICVNDDRATIGVKKRNASWCQQHAIGGERNSPDPARRCHYVRRITSVRTARVLESVLLPEWIEMSTGGGERSRAAFAQAYRVEVNAMRARWEREARDLDVYESIPILPQLGGSDWSSIDVVQDGYRLCDGVARYLRRRARSGYRDHQCCVYE
jgi:hypothetical protein